MSPTERDLQPSSGLFSNVFGFVSREIESFVNNAVGAPEKSTVEVYDSRQSGSRVKVTSTERIKKKRRRGEDVRRRARDSRSPEPCHEQSKRADATRVHQPETCDAEDNEDTTRSPTPPPLPRALRRRPSISMPGSLYPRTSSLEPDSFEDHIHEENDRHVRFAPGVISPPRTHSSNSFRDENEPGPSRMRMPTTSKTRELTPDNLHSSPLRPRAVPSVRDAVRRFTTSGDDADSSILLPSPSSSPGKTKTRDGKGKERESSHERTLPSSRDKGKGRARDYLVDLAQADTSGEIRVRGKEQELIAAREEQMQKERRWERDKDGGEIEAARERDRDKEKIKMLEEEVIRLKAELSKRPVASRLQETYHHSRPPPPPPPPPPPLSSSTTAMRVPLAPTSGTESLFASARAALKQTAPPVEAPINAPGVSRAKRQGQPTVNVPSEKMAAFLTEMKTVRLRKVSSGSQGPPPGPSTLGGSSLGRSVSASAGSARTSASFGRDILRRNNSLKAGGSALRSSKDREDDSRVGEKRKRDSDAASEFQDALHVAVKRRSLASSDTNSFASTSTATSKSNLLPSRLPIPTSFSRSYPPPSLSSRTWPSISTETDLTTPSLCSDNDVEPADETSLEELPPTPTVLPPRAESKPLQRKEQREVIDVDMEHEPGRASDAPRLRPDSAASTTNPVSPQVRRVNDAFSKRPPSSPMPIPTPRKPKPPGRARGRPVSFSKPRHGNGSDDDDPLSLSFSPPEPESHLLPISRDTSEPRARKRSSAVSRAPSRDTREPSVTSARSGSYASSSKIRRRATLDEELRDATRDEDDIDLDSGVLTGVGTRSKRTGFLAHGGAGGAPVFMGVGYVEGAEEEAQEESDEDEDYQPSRRRLNKPAPTVKAKRKSKR